MARTIFMNDRRMALMMFVVVTLLGALLAVVGGQGGTTVFGMPVFALLIGLAYLIQWLAFIPAFVMQTERFFDITGGLTYILLIGLAALLSPNLDARSILLAVLVVIWAARLGLFLFGRIQRAGKDSRFDEIKPSFIHFLNYWNIQALWISFTLAAALIVITTMVRKELDAFALIGGLIWVFGFALEVIADGQKSRFKADPHNTGKFIQSGLWSRSRHPNYFGEIMLWIGIAVIALPVFQGWGWIGLISPVFVILLLTRASGIPMLEAAADKKWGGQPEYEAYKQNTPALIPRL
jgi:steroid 5-alpha reductase family enzyme